MRVGARQGTRGGIEQLAASVVVGPTLARGDKMQATKSCSGTSATIANRNPPQGGPSWCVKGAG